MYCNIQTYECNVTDSIAVQKILHCMPKLIGIIHSAGILHDSSFQKLTWQNFAAVLDCKIIGSWVLHEYTMQNPVKYFVLFSSLASIIGSRGQTNYAMANAFLDGLVELRKANQKHALAINWGPWSEIGMAAGMSFPDLSSFTVVQGLSSFKYAMYQNQQENISHVICCHCNWKNLCAKHRCVAPLAASFIEHQDHNKPVTMESTQVASADKNIETVASIICSILRDTLHMSPTMDIDDEIGFMEMGLDSILSNTFINKLSEKFSDAMLLTEADLFDHSNVKSLAKYIAHGLHNFKKPSAATDTPEKFDDTVSITEAELFHHCNAESLTESGAQSTHSLEEANADTEQHTCEHSQRNCSSLESMVNDALVQELKSVLHFSDSHIIDCEMGFMELGLDSILGLHFVNRMYERLHVVVSDSELFDYANLSELTQFVSSKIGENKQNLTQLPTYQSGATGTTPPAQDLECTRIEDEIICEDTKSKQAFGIIGLSLRLPGGINDSSSLWDMLKSGCSVSCSDNLARIQDILPCDEAQGMRFCALQEKVVKCFDANFFHISPNEAKLIDPQHRILLELTYEAIESAGLSPRQLSNASVGVFIGVAASDYTAVVNKITTINDISHYMGPGLIRSAVAGRIAHHFDLKGPVMTIDTACSSSLAALHCALQNLKDHQCEFALVGASNIILDPSYSAALEKSGVISKSGMCKSFDVDGDGYVRSEGCCMILLGNVLESELSARMHCKLEIVNCRVMHDGHSSNLTAPNGLTQQMLIQNTIQTSSVEPVVTVECHGTGTTLGDGVEMASLCIALQHPTILNSIKTNLGHLEATAGLGSIIKVLLSLQHNYLPPSLHFQLSSSKKVASSNHCISVLGMETKAEQANTALINSFWLYWN